MNYTSSPLQDLIANITPALVALVVVLTFLAFDVRDALQAAEPAALPCAAQCEPQPLAD